MKRALAVSFGAGLLFAVGLGLSGMTQPGKVLAFLDVTGDWDPSLALVMAGAIGVHAVFVRIASARAKPYLVETFDLPRAKQIDARLVLGSALFGAGWGIAGYCPGPALVSLASFHPSALIFVGSMALGMSLHGLVPPTSKPLPAPPDQRLVASS